MSIKKDKIFVAGHKGLVGSAVLRKLKKLKYINIIIADKKKLNLLDQKKVFDFLKKKKYKIYNNMCCQSRRYQSK